MIRLRQLILQSLQGLIKRYHGRIQPAILKQLYDADPSKNKNYSSAMCQLYLQGLALKYQNYTPQRIIKLFSRYNDILLKKSKFNIAIPNQVQLFKDLQSLVKFVQQAQQQVKDKIQGNTIVNLFKERQRQHNDIKVIFRNSN